MRKHEFLPIPSLNHEYDYYLHPSRMRISEGMRLCGGEAGYVAVIDVVYICIVVKKLLSVRLPPTRGSVQSDFPTYCDGPEGTRVSTHPPILLILKERNDLSCLLISLAPRIRIRIYVLSMR